MNDWVQQYDLLKLHLDELQFLIEWGEVNVQDLQKFVMMQKREWTELIDKLEGER